MILEELGVLSTAQDLLAGAVDSENVIDLGAIADVGLNQAWLSIICETANTGGTTDTYVFDLVISQEATLDTNRKILTVEITGSADPRIAAIERNIANFEIGHQLAELVDGTYRYLGLISTLADVNGTAAVSINAAVSPGMPRTRDNVQVTRSNVTIPS
ncbi:hypothetical protein LCGC14_2760300 [marine sediment metagenome]|uniref:Baseplate protein J-like domain-containing protein n=1 Tax=marine sediment metagenome TaxID=412755 RepID=A0A0F8YZ77_9ZZZZ